jgi:hypothetical protein
MNQIFIKHVTLSGTALLLLLGGCSAGDADPVHEPAAETSAQMVSAYSSPGVQLEVSGRPDAEGSFDVVLKLQTADGEKVLAFNPRTADEQLLPKLQDILSHEELLKEVRSTLTDAASPGTQAQAHWLDFQRGLFMAVETSASVPQDSCTWLGGWWHYCYRDGHYHCCLFDHASICDLICKAL